MCVLGFLCCLSISLNPASSQTGTPSTNAPDKEWRAVAAKNFFRAGGSSRRTITTARDGMCFSVWPGGRRLCARNENHQADSTKKYHQYDQRQRKPMAGKADC